MRADALAPVLFEALNPVQRTIVALVHHEGLTAKQAADVLDLGLDEADVNLSLENVERLATVALEAYRLGERSGRALARLSDRAVAPPRGE